VLFVLLFCFDFDTIHSTCSQFKKSDRRDSFKKPTSSFFLKKK